MKDLATHLNRDIFKGFYVDKLLAAPKLRALKNFDFKGCPALSGYAKKL